MPNLKSVVWSSVGKKLITGITGFGLLGFIVVHLLGNLTLLIGPHAFNSYAHFLEGLVHGIFIYIFEAGLILIMLFHIWAGLEVSVLGKYRARPVRYKKTASAGGRSRKTLSSITMIITGAIILVFLVWHVKMFKYGGAQIVGEGDHAMKDLYTVVLEAFKDPMIVGAYVIVMICLGFHLRHATWSAFQSLGMTRDETLPLLNRIAVAFAVIMTIGFCFLPIFMYLADLPPEAHAALMEGGR